MDSPLLLPMTGPQISWGPSRCQLQKPDFEWHTLHKPNAADCTDPSGPSSLQLSVIPPLPSCPLGTDPDLPAFDLGQALSWRSGQSRFMMPVHLMIRSPTSSPSLRTL